MSVAMADHLQVINPHKYVNIDGKRFKFIIKFPQIPKIQDNSEISMPLQKSIPKPKQNPDIAIENPKTFVPKPETQKPLLKPKRQENLGMSHHLKTPTKLMPKRQIQKPKRSSHIHVAMPDQSKDRKKLIPRPEILEDKKPHNGFLRDNIKEQILQGLSMVFQEAQDEEFRTELKRCNPGLIASSIESLLFVKWGLSNTACRPKYRSLIFNVKDPKNPDFRRKLLLGTIKPEELANMNAQEMASDDRKRENQVIRERKLYPNCNKS
ncbi:transcription elongation factor TFIIS-like [Mercurialis annua]|uniref:transcription elongation factor TFIIS-like n=1 Tax=Mercurialis annua TaxID=3986 RepID=UPI00215E7AA0|nr:transcription elongation factor TFIIS-like [Mercurialis annua]